MYGGQYGRPWGQQPSPHVRENEAAQRGRQPARVQATNGNVAKPGALRMASSGAPVLPGRSTEVKGSPSPHLVSSASVSPVVGPATPKLKRIERPGVPSSTTSTRSWDVEDEIMKSLEEPDQYAIAYAPASSNQIHAAATVNQNQPRRGSSPVGHRRRSSSPMAKGQGGLQNNLQSRSSLNPQSPHFLFPRPAYPGLQSEMRQLQTAMILAFNTLEMNESCTYEVLMLAQKFKRTTAWAYGHDVSADGLDVILSSKAHEHRPSGTDLEINFLKMLPLLILHYVDAQPIDPSILPGATNPRSNFLRSISDVLEALSLAVHDNVDNLKVLTSIDYIDASLNGMLQCGYERARENSFLCLSSIALSAEHSSLMADDAALRKNIKDNLQRGCPEVKEAAALLLNNIAALGGEGAIETLSHDHSLMRALIDLVHVGDGLQLMRAVSAFFHLSMSYRSAKFLTRYDLASVMTEVLTREGVDGGGKTTLAYRAFATMTLANLATSNDDADELISDSKSVASLVTFLKLALDKTPFNGIYFRVHDVLYSLSVVSKNQSGHSVLRSCGLAAIVIDIVKQWKPGKYAGYFSSQRENTHPVLEAATDVLHALCQTEYFRDEMKQRNLLPILDELMIHDHDAVQLHAAKVLWSLRDRAVFLVHAQQVVDAVRGIQSICSHFSWTDRERILRVNGVLHGHELGAQVSAVCQWMSSTIQTDQLDTIKYLLNGAQARNVGTVFRAFRHAVHRQRQSSKIEKMSETARNILIRMRNFNEAKAMSGWKDLLKHKRNAIARVREIIFMWTNQSLVRAFNNWNGGIKTRKYRDGVLKRVLGHWINKSMAISWTAWSGRINDKKRLLRAAMKIIGHWTHRNLSAPFDTWRTDTKRNMYIKSVMMNIVFKMQNRGSAVAFDTWKSHVNHLVRSANIINRCLRHWMNRTLAAVLEAWKGHVSNKYRLIRTAKKILLMWNRRSLAIPFTSWLDHKNSIVHSREVVANVIFRMQNRSIAIALYTWKTNHEDRLTATARVKKSIQHWLNSSKSKCFASWFQSTKSQKRTENMTNKVVARWMHRGVSKSFDTWSAIVKETKENIQKMRRVILMWQRKTLSEAWNAWKYKMQHEQRMEFVLNKIVGRWTHMGVSAAWSSWVYKVKHGKRMDIVLKKILSRWTHMGIAEAWSTWASKVDHEKRMDYILKKIILRWGHMNISEAWTAWVEKCKFERRMEFILNKIIGRWSHMALSRPFNAWLDRLQNLANSRATAKQVILKLLHLSIGKAFVGFREGCIRQGVIYARLSKIVVKWQMLNMSSSFERWHQQTVTLRVLKNKLHKVLIRWSKRPMFSAFLSWRAHSGHQKLLLSMSRKVVLVWTHQVLYTYFRVLVDICKPKKAKQVAASKKVAYAIKKMLFKSVVHAFEAWTDFTFNPQFLMGDTSCDPVDEFITAECSISPGLLGTDFEGILILETASALKISKGRVVLSNFDSQSNNVTYKIIRDSTTRGPTCREIYADMMHQLQNSNSALRQCTIAGQIAKCNLQGYETETQNNPNVPVFGMKKSDLIGELHVAQSRAHQVEQELRGLKGMQNSMSMNVGIDITKEAPYVVNEVLDVMDMNGVLQGEEEYLNMDVLSGDELMAIEDRDVTNASMDKVKAMLRGPPYSVVSLTLKRAAAQDGLDLTFKVNVVRHVSANRLPQDSDDDDDNLLSSVFNRKKGVLGFLNFAPEERRLQRL